MIRFLKHSEIDKDRWNLTIKKSLNTTIFADFDFLSVSCPDWCALVEDDYLSVMPLPIRSKLSIKYIYTPFFSNRLGVFSSEVVTAQKVKEFLDAIPKKFRQVDLILNEKNPCDLIEDKVIGLISHTLDLNQTYEEISEKYNQNTSRNIKSAQKQGLQYIENANIKGIIKLFIRNRGKQKNVHYKARDYVTLIKMARHARNHGFLDTIGVIHEKKLIAGALFLRDSQRLWFWFSGRDNQYADKKPMFFLLDEYIRHNANQTLQLDFNGSMNENVARLYKGLGGTPYPVNMIYYTRDFYLGKLIKLYKLIKR